MTTDAFKLFNNFRDNQWIVQTHLSGDEFHKYVSPDLTMISSPISVLEGLNEILEPAVLSFDLSWIKAARNGFEKGQQPQVQPGLVDMGLVITMIQKLLPSDAIITNGAGNFAIWPNKFMQFSAKQRLLAPQSGAMGYGLPAAIAAKLEQPDRCVLCFSGDGDFQMNFQELGTALQSNARPIVLILNNGTYGTIRMHQEKIIHRG
jgi:acetolactate synthase-1/2/3 large subunit